MAKTLVGTLAAHLDAWTAVPKVALTVDWTVAETADLLDAWSVGWMDAGMVVQTAGQLVVQLAVTKDVALVALMVAWRVGWMGALRAGPMVSSMADYLDAPTVELTVA